MGTLSRVAAAFLLAFAGTSCGSVGVVGEAATDAGLADAGEAPPEIGLEDAPSSEADAEEDGAVTPIDSGSDDTLTSDTTPVAETSVEVDTGSVLDTAPVAGCGNGICEAGEACGGACASDCAGPSVYYVNPGESIQSAMDKAQAYARCISPTWPNHTLQDTLFGKVVLQPGVHTLAAPLATRAHVRIEATGAQVVRGAGSHIMYVDDNGGGGYKAPPYWTIVGGVWNANGGGGFSIVHTRKFVLWDMEIKDIGYTVVQFVAKAPAEPKLDL